MKKSLFALFLAPLLCFAQLDEDYEYDKEFIWGINKNTNGGVLGSLVFKWSRSMGNDVYRTFGFELSNVKHPKETRTTSQTGQTFIIGKTNYLYTIRLQYGRDKLLFRKDTQQGVQINVGFMGGPTIGFHAPYYILTNDGNYEKYDPLVHFDNGAAGPGKLFQGLGQSETRLGVNVKGGVSFEFGTYKNNVAGIETGVMIEAFTRPVVLMPTQDNRAVFPSAYILLYWGKRK
ncbi:MAG: hypothetical protein RIF46_08975 [Cyclobacteriaceae bacterium]